MEWGLSGFFEQSFNGNLTAGTDYSSPIGSPTLQKIFDNNLFTLQTIQENMANMTKAITTYMRLNGDSSSSAPATRIVHRSATGMAFRAGLGCIPDYFVLRPDSLGHGDQRPISKLEVVTCAVTVPWPGCKLEKEIEGLDAIG